MKSKKLKTLAYLAAGGTAAGFASTAQADLIFNSGNLAAGTEVNDSVAGLDLDGDGTVDINIGHDADGGYSGISYAVATASAVAGNGAVGSFYASAGASSNSASAGLSFASGPLYLWDGSGFIGSQFVAGTTNFLGVQFDVGGATHFGFVELFVSDDANPNGAATSNVVTIVNYAFQDQAGDAAHFEQPPAVPEPGSLGLFALGAAGLAMFRRRKAS